MKILLDENIDVRFKYRLEPMHEVFTVRDMGWNGVKNGALLQLLKDHQFDCWVVVDKNIPYQQNVEKLPCLVTVMDVRRNTLPHLAALVPKLLRALETPGSARILTIQEGVR